MGYCEIIKAFETLLQLGFIKASDV